MSYNVLEEPFFWQIYRHEAGWDNNALKLDRIVQLIVYNPLEHEAVFEVLNSIADVYPANRFYLWPLLIDLAVQSTHPQLQQIALAQLDKVKDRIIDILFTRWYYDRNPVLEPLILNAGLNGRQGNLSRSNQIHLLLKKGLGEKIGYLTEFKINTLLSSCSDPDPTISSNARAVLQGANQQGLFNIAQVWNANRQPLLLEVLLQRDFLDKIPSRKIQINLALKFLRLDPVSLDGAELVRRVADVVRDKDTEIAANARLVLGQLPNPAAQEAVCQLILKGERPDLVQIAIAADYTPADLTNRAVFYILTEQWEKYEALAIDPLMVQMVYRTGTTDIRKRLSQHIQASGRPDLLQLLAGSNRALTTAELSREAGRLLIETLEKEQRWGQLWALLPELPLRRGLQVLERLATLPDWQPANQTEQVLFAELKTLAAGPMLTSAKQIERFIPASLKLYRSWLLQFCESPGDSTNDFSLFQNFKASEGYANLPENLKNTLAYIEALMRYRWQYAIELGEAEDGLVSQFDIELD